MLAPMEDFFRALRAAGVGVTPAEAIDAHRALASVGYGDRELVRDALCATLAKSADEVVAFETTFDRFFQRAPLSGQARTPEADERQKSSEGDAPPPPAMTSASDEGQPPSSGSALGDLVLGGDAAALAQAMEAAAERAGVNEIRLSTQRSRMTRRLLDEMGLAQIEQIIASARRLEGGEALASRLEAGRTALMEQAREYIERQHDLFASGSGKALREEALARRALNADAGIDPVDMVMMQALVRRMARRLADRYSRRRNRARRGHMDVRRTLRMSMAHGGLPFQIAWKTQKVDRPKIVAICDVSKSVAAAAQFLLTFLYALNEVVQQLDAFAFSGRLVSVSDVLDDNGPEAAILQVLQKIGFQQTDYGRALQDFHDNHLSSLDRHTTVIFLGDGRSNYADPRLDLMKEIHDRSRSVIWLNPEPETYWAQGDSVMHRYARFCHVAKTCNTLESLERIIDDVLRTYVPH